ncbi:hypothetical protein Bpfe_011632 [Biomphalaria pfeifferi]|uniref:Uncharacterized protein n=1 Tax=Biomphalaria pfeifferi TaxID=112525 RepID=A0AAD8BQH0_BIOPF|nr:hypothetical protein Bpfe_011632 [Biomphalaria pfeifferi]
MTGKKVQKQQWKQILTVCLLIVLFLVSFGFVILPQFLTYNIRYKESLGYLTSFYNLSLINYASTVEAGDPSILTTSMLYHTTLGLHNTTELRVKSPLITTTWSTTVIHNVSTSRTTAASSQASFTKSVSLPPSSNVPTSSSASTRKKYLIYLCDSKKYCFGLGDRQRGLVSVYLLAEVTNRTFGLVMTSPSNFTEFYQPSLVNWEIPEAELLGKSTIVLEGLGGKTDFKLESDDFNANFTQDVIYIRTNQKFHYNLLKNPIYKDKFPEWARPPHWKLYQTGWMRLMLPSSSLRSYLNEILVQIHDIMREERQVWEVINSTSCCMKSEKCANISCKNESLIECCRHPGATNSSSTPAACSNYTCSNSSSRCSNTSLTRCLTNTCALSLNCNSSVCDSVECSPVMRQTKCIDKLGMLITNSSDVNRTISMANNLCLSPPLTTPLTATRESIRSSKHYEPVNLNMVCVHIRLGHSKTMPFENNVRNKVGEEKAVWKFLTPYVNNGSHVYLATDSEEVRQEAKRLFGYRLHISTVPIVHIAAVQEGQDKVLGFRLTLMEQLLLATSCSTLVVSYSGFSMKAAQFRYIMQPGIGQLFIYRNAKVWPVNVGSLL